MDDDVHLELKYHCDGVPGCNNSEIPFHNIDSVSYVSCEQFRHIIEDSYSHNAFISLTVLSQKNRAE